MKKTRDHTTQLPKKLIDEIGGQDSGNHKRKGGIGVGRKEKRKAERAGKKLAKIQGRQRTHTRAGQEPESESENELKTFTPQAREGIEPVKRPFKQSISIKKPSKLAKEENVESRGKKSVSKAVRDRLAEDDDEISALERKLGLKSKRKLPKAFEDDGLDVLMDGLDGSLSSGSDDAPKREEREWLERKRRKAREALNRSGSEEESDDDEGSISSSGTRGEESYSEDDFSGFDSDISDAIPQVPRVKENPYVAPVTSDLASVKAKYIPPSLRKASNSDSEILSRLRRQVQGLLNRLSEANLISILGDVEKLYRDQPRQHVTSTLIDLLVGLVSDRTALSDTFLILHAGFISAIYKVVGSDFGAQTVERIVTELDQLKALSSESSGKETINLITLLSLLYNFQVIASNAIFDYIRLCLSSLTESSTELLLKIIKTSGPQLRQDNPSSIKDIVALLAPAVSAIGEPNLSVRTRFMLETINDLKNNKLKTGAAASAVTSEHTIQMKKILGSLNTRSLRATEPLRIGLADIRDTDKKGKWWLVGASYKDFPESSNTNHTSKTTEPDEDLLDDATTSLVSLARAHRMNTDIRRAIFVTLMSSTDYHDAHLRLLKLRLKRAQELEVPRVLLHCAGAEAVYNPYYTLIARKLCADKKLKMAFQFSLWDLFKRLGENRDEDNDAQDEDGGDEVELRTIVNLGKLYGSLASDGAVSLRALKVLNLLALGEKAKVFVEVFLITLFLALVKAKGKNEDGVVAVFMGVKDEPGLARGLQWFLKKVVVKTDIAGGDQEVKSVKWACAVARDTLSVIASSDRRVE